MELGLSLAGLDRSDGLPWSGGAKAALRWGAGLGFRSVALDGMGVRARDFDRSARRDLAATLRRLELALAGIDLWIPPGHFADLAHADRAVAAVVGALGLVGELRDLDAGIAPVVSIALPGDVDAGTVSALRAAGEGVDVALADHSCPPNDSLGVGLDPATVIFGGGDPVARAAALGDRLVAARLSDADGAGRAVPGETLDLLAYRATLEIARIRTVTLDLRGLPEQQAAAQRAKQNWSSL